jgi:hypothetical protein
MNIFKRLSTSVNKFIGSDNIGIANKTAFIGIEVIPREVADIEVGLSRPALFVSHLYDDANGYESLNNAIVDIENIGFRFLTYVVPENLFFFFSESEESLRLAFTAFMANYGIVYKSPYFMKDYLCPKNADDYYRGYKGQPDIWAIVLCKVINVEAQNALRGKIQKSSDYGNCYKIGWGEFQKVYKIFYDSVFHIPNDNSKTALKL